MTQRILGRHDKPVIGAAGCEARRSAVAHPVHYAPLIDRVG
jgi:hypothetical protein